MLQLLDTRIEIFERTKQRLNRKADVLMAASISLMAAVAATAVTSTLN
jgi:hypothetical protein